MKISVIVPVFNQEIFLGRCLRSLLQQTIPNKTYEIIVINDGSNDKTEYAISLFKDPKNSNIKILKNENNRGLPFSVNKGIKASTGEYIVRVDSDDYVNKNFLQILEIYLDYNEKSNAVACDYLIVDDKEGIIKRENVNENPIACGIMFRRRAIDKVGDYDEKFLLNEDKEFRYRFEKIYSIDKLPIPLYRYRRHKKNITNDLKKMEFYDEMFYEKHKLK